MPSASPVSPSHAQTPRSHGFPFPSLDSSAAFSSNASISTAATSISEWPRGPAIAPLQYNMLRERDDVAAQLEFMLLNLGQWLTAADAGMAILADA